ncbi:MAG: nuclear transport factor 2 family protein [Desulfobacterales bacterium]|jgi:ketosteroid isomerase-like protein|uniref:Nuclear transport factor 2 family protein n=1 Tax=Candidatus Desulfatibia vada TaxID=2841696 RepID=A0A8J6P6F2_9BACT|nr:nuclear transport factor 2 family protein [Candidatus Desulfatibia vada]MBW1852116.1 nuclear transport factor 2 family protein [Deltaproteobacteria bacterium]
MEQSTELKELYLRSCEAQSSGDYSFFERHFSQKDGVLAIGTDPMEWWAGYASITRVFKAQLKETGGFQILADTPQAYSDGSIGWVAGQPTVKLPDGTEMQLRLTAVFQKEHDDWKIVQWHVSTGVANKDLIGETLTTQ